MSSKPDFMFPDSELFFRSLKKIAIALVFLGLATKALAQDYTSTEDRSRFREQLYKNKEPGLLAPDEYVELAKKAIHARFKDVHFNIFTDGVVSHRLYRNAPPADRDIICVTFLYQGKISGGGWVGGGNIITNPDPLIPGIVALIRKDRSKIYVNEIGVKHGN